MTKKILLIESNQQYREYCARTLSDYLLSIAEADNGQTGLELFFAETPDLVIVELNVSGIDGEEVCSIIRKSGIGESIPIIALSSTPKSEESCKKLKRELQLTAVLVKPFDISALMEEIDGQLHIGYEAVEEDIIGIDDLLLEGDISKEDNFAALLLRLQGESQTGVLTLSDGELSRVVYIEAGSPVHFAPADENDSLCAYLRRKGKIRPQEERDVLSLIEHQSMSETAAVVRKAVLDSADADAAMEEVMLYRAAKMYMITRGTFHFISDRTFLGTVELCNFQVHSVLYHCVKATISPFEVEQQLGSMPRHNFLHIEENCDEWFTLDISAEEQKMLKGLRKGKTVSQTLSFIKANPPAAPLLKLLRDIKLIRIVEEKPKPPVQDKASLMIHQALDELNQMEKEKHGSGEVSTEQQVTVPIDIIGVDIETDIFTIDTDQKKTDNTHTVRGEKFQQICEQLMTLDYFSLLDTSPENFDASELTKLYFQIARNYHPELLGPQLEKRYKDMAGELFKRIKTAYLTLKDDTKRNTYLREQGLSDEDDFAEMPLEEIKESTALPFVEPEVEESNFGEEKQNVEDDLFAPAVSDLPDFDQQDVLQLEDDELELEIERPDFSVPHSIDLKSPSPEKTSPQHQSISMENNEMVLEDYLDQKTDSLSFDQNSDMDFGDYGESDSEGPALQENDPFMADTMPIDLPAQPDSLELDLDDDEEAKQVFDNGKQFMNNDDLDQALQCFDEACLTSPLNNEFAAWKSWTTYLIGKKNGNKNIIDKGKTELKRLVKSDKTCERALFFLGKILVMSKQYEQAEEILNKALNLKKAKDVKAELNNLNRLRS